MLKIDGHHIWRGGDKIGYVEGNHLYNHEGHRVGYWTDDSVYDMNGNRLLRIEKNNIIAHDGTQHHLDNVIGDIPSATLDDTAKVAIKTFFGD